MKRTNSEAQLHRSVAQFLSKALKPPTVWTTIGHGGGGRIRGAQLKAMGVQKGWPDILVMHPCGDGPWVLGIELKAKKGRQSPEQMDCARRFRDATAFYEVCYSVEDVEAELNLHGIPLSASVRIS